MTPDYYTLLGVARSADDDIIRAAYLVLAKRYHPDTAAVAHTDNAEKFRIVAEAYEVLRDSSSRAYYDWCHARQEQKVAQQTHEHPSEHEQQNRAMRDPGRTRWSTSISNPLVYSAGAVALLVALLLGLINVIAVHGPSANADVAMRTEKSEQSPSVSRDTAALEEVTDLRRALHRTERLAATTQEALERERFHSQGLEKQLAARGDNEKLLAEERVRSLKLEQQLAVREDRETPPAQERAIRGLAQQLTVPPHASPARGYGAIASPSDMFQRSPPPASNDAATALLPTVDTPVIPAVDNSAMLGQPQAPGNPEAARLMARGRVLLDQGNIAGARNVLQRAAEMGSAPALFSLAETYDPAMLSAWRTLGTQGDVGKAQELYAKAIASGAVREK